MDTIRCSGFVALFEARGEGKFSARTASFYLLITARSPGSILRGGRWNLTVRKSRVYRLGRVREGWLVSSLILETSIMLF